MTDQTTERCTVTRLAKQRSLYFGQEQRISRTPHSYDQRMLAANFLNFFMQTFGVLRKVG